MPEIYTPTYDEVRLFIEVVRSISNYNFSNYSIKSFSRRIEKVMSDYNIEDIEDLIVKVINNKKFLDKVVKNITVNTTEFFRDPEMWIELISLIDNYLSDKEKIYIWHAGCSTGQEVYSMIILLDQLGLLDKSEIYGTDLNEDVLNIAKNGEYRYKEIMDYRQNFEEVVKYLPEQITLEKYFFIDEKRSIIKAKPSILGKATFLKHDLVNDGNVFGKKFDLIMCRNVMIYFDTFLQDKLFNFFYQNLTDEGILVLGKHEGMLGDIALRFKRENGFYIKKSSHYNDW